MREKVALPMLLLGELMVLSVIAALGDLRPHIPLYLALFGLAAVLFGLATWHVLHTRISFQFIIVSAIALRIPMFFTEPSLSDDVWRYLHDGRAQLAGTNPYAFAPSDPRTVVYRGPEFDRINHPDVPTIYPPLAQMGFRVAAAFPAPLFAWRIILLAAELALLLTTAILLRGRFGNLAIYAWHPLAITEGIGSAHIDPLAITFLVIAIVATSRMAAARAGAALAVSVAIKLVAAPLLLLLTRKRAVTVFAIVLVIYMSAALTDQNAWSTISLFAQTWESNGSLFALLEPVMGGRIYRTTAAASVIAGLWILRRRHIALPDAAATFFMMLFLLAPVVHPWYLLWILALLPLRNNPLDGLGAAALLWTMTVVVAYTAHQQMLRLGVWHIPAPMLWIEYLPVYAALIYALASRKLPIRIHALRYQ